jgi:hypothetical protein
MRNPLTTARALKRAAISRHTQCRSDSDETGAVIVLALVFLISVSLIVLALLSWVGTSLTASAKFSDERTAEAAATSAVNLAIQNTRYTFTSAMVNASPPVQCWGSTLASAPPSSLSVDGQKFDVWCSMVWQPFSQTAQNRTVTYSACPDPTTGAQCAAAPTLQAIVAFDDSPGGAAPVPSNHPVPCTTPPNGYCGESMTQQSWQWNPTVPSVSSISVTSAPSTALSGGSPITMQINGSGFVDGSTVDFVQETGANPGPGVVPAVADVPITPAGQEQGVTVPATVTPHSVSCSGPGNTNCSLQVTVPAVTSGPDYFVTVTTPGGTSPYETPGGSYIHFGYTAVTPVVSSISGTTSGAITGGTLITVNGPANGTGGFYSAPNFAAQVIFCSATPCITTGANPTGWLGSDVTVTSSSQLTAISPPINATGITYPASFYVEVNTVGGTSTNTGAAVTFTYSVQVPIIFSITPTSGPASTLLTISGYNFVSGSTVAWIQVSSTDQDSTPSNNAVNSQTVPSTITGTQITVTVPTLPNPNGNGNGTTTYVPMVIDPGGNTYSQPYNEPADEFVYPHS